MPIDLLSLDENEVKLLVADIGVPSYRAKQISEWLGRGVSPEGMTNLPATLRTKLANMTEWRMPVIEKRLISSDGTKKYLLRLIDGECVEAVYMKYEHGNTVCVSSQVGCRMGCRFCASTIGGRVRDLTASEILGEVMAVAADNSDNPADRVSGIVMMGIGEPLDNYNNTVKFLRLVSAPGGLNIGARHISVSTCGVVPQIKALADEGLQVTLSVSLHASNDDTRDALMPINRKYSIGELLEACSYYFDKTGRRVSFEYTLIAGKNDSVAEAERLAKLIGAGMAGACHVNLIPLNPVDETGLAAPSATDIDRFKNILLRYGINATVRRHLGGDINASCGQLRKNSLRK